MGGPERADPWRTRREHRLRLVTVDGALLGRHGERRRIDVDFLGAYPSEHSTVKEGHETPRNSGENVASLAAAATIEPKSSSIFARVFA